MKRDLRATFSTNGRAMTLPWFGLALLFGNVARFAILPLNDPICVRVNRYKRVNQGFSLTGLGRIDSADVAASRRAIDAAAGRASGVGIAA